MKTRRAAILAILFAGTLAAPTGRLLADGGTLQVSQPCGPFRVSAFTSPAVLRAGPIDISLLLQALDTGIICSDIPTTISLESIDRPGTKLVQEATTATATNKLFKAVQFEVPQPGNWRTKIEVRGPASTEALDFVIDVAPALPRWFDLAPWLGWPLGVVGLFIAHQHLVARRDDRPPAMS